MPPPLTFRPIARSTRRAVGFLEGHSELDAEEEFDGLGETGRNTLMARIDLWIDEGRCDKYFHGFTSDSNPKYREHFVFKWKRHRWYGYLCHPQPTTKPAFWLCVLVIHALKSEHDTDRAELARVYQWQWNLAAKQAVALHYPDGKERKECIH